MIGKAKQHPHLQMNKPVSCDDLEAWGNALRDYRNNINDDESERRYYRMWKGSALLVMAKICGECPLPSLWTILKLISAIDWLSEFYEAPENRSVRMFRSAPKMIAEFLQMGRLTENVLLNSSYYSSVRAMTEWLAVFTLRKGGHAERARLLANELLSVETNRTGKKS